MSTRRLIVTMAALLPLAAQGEDGDNGQEKERYANLAGANRPVQTSLDDDFAGRLQMGGAYTFDDSYMFGQYNGLSEEELSLIGDVRFQEYGADSYWQASVTDLGLDTREGRLTWGRADRMRIELGFDSQRQVRNDSGRTPFSGDYTQVLPDSWVSGVNTQDFAALDSALRGFDRELERNALNAGLDLRLSEHWKVRSSMRYEEKEGHDDVGTGIYINGASADAVFLRRPVDYLSLIHI